jgi:hypothetical protein
MLCYVKYKVVQIWPGLIVCKQVTVCPGHIWTTLYMRTHVTPPRLTWKGLVTLPTIDKHYCSCSPVIKTVWFETRCSLETFAVFFCYSGITSTKSPSSCRTTFSASITNLTFPLHQSRDWNCYVSRRILAPPQSRLRNWFIYAHMASRSPYLWYQSRLAEFIHAWSWRLCENTSAIPMWESDTC